MGLWDRIIVQPIFNLLLALYGLVGDFGIAIIIFTIVMKLVIWPLTKKQLKQAKLMRKLQPELAEIKKNCRGNRQLESIQMMDLYKRNNVRPLASLLPLILQIPIMIALFSVVRNALGNAESIQKFAYGFIGQMPRVSEMIHNFSEFSPGLFGLDLRLSPFPLNNLAAGVWLAVAAASCVLMYVSMKQQQPGTQKKRRMKDIFKEAAAGKDVDQAEVNAIVSGQMSKMMPLMMLLVMINMPGALVLYFMTTNLLTVLMQKRTFNEDFMEMDNLADKKVLRELEEAQEGQVIRIKATDKKRKKK